MRGELKKQGNYEWFKTDEGHDILKLEDNYYAMVEGDQGAIIVKSDSDHKKEKTVSDGKFYFADFEDDPAFQDTPHLFLEQDGKYKEFILPNGFPTDSNVQKKLVRVDEKLSSHKVMEHIKGKG